MLKFLFWNSCNNVFCTVISINVWFLFQYYEMSYGLNVEMHKQVSTHTHIPASHFVISYMPVRILFILGSPEFMPRLNCFIFVELCAGSVHFPREFPLSRLIHGLFNSCDIHMLYKRCFNTEILFKSSPVWEITASMWSDGYVQCLHSCNFERLHKLADSNVTFNKPKIWIMWAHITILDLFL